MDGFSTKKCEDGTKNDDQHLLKRSLDTYKESSDSINTYYSLYESVSLLLGVAKNKLFTFI